MEKPNKNQPTGTELPQLCEWSLGAYQVLRSQRYTMEQIAGAFGVTRRTLYNRINKNKKATPDRAANSLPPDMESGGIEPPKFTASA